MSQDPPTWQVSPKIAELVDGYSPNIYGRLMGFDPSQYIYGMGFLCNTN